MQKLIDGVSGYYSHNTGGEHTARVLGDEHYINALRVRNGLEPNPDLDIFHYAHDNDGYVMLHQNMPDGSGIRPELAGYTLARRIPEPYGYAYEIDDLLVDEPLRGNGLGKFLIGKLANKGVYHGRAVYYPLSLRIASDLLTEPTRQWLLSRDFREKDDVLELGLPGTMMEYVPEGDLQDLVARMPENWDGCIGTYSESEDDTGELHVYRTGQHFGSVTRAGGSRYVDEDTFLVNYRLSIEDQKPQEAEFTSEFFAVVALLNRPVVQT